MIHWDPSITLGVVLQLVSLLVVAAAVYRRIVLMEQKVNLMFAWWLKQSGANGETERR